MAANDAPKRVFLLPHPVREDAWEVAAKFTAKVQEAGLECVAASENAARFGKEYDLEVASQEDSANCDLIVSFGGDGTILRAAAIGREYATPILGVNLGRLGFLVEAEAEELDAVVAAVVAQDYTLETRDTLTVEVHRADGSVEKSWALNEVAIEKGAHTNMLDLFVAIDGQPVSRWACDGVVCATPTGSTAYSWSAGGPVVWPDVEAIVVVPASAHALFSRPMVVGPQTEISIKLSDRSAEGVAACDGRRIVAMTQGDSAEIQRSDKPVVFARLHEVPFAERLVRKFELPISGWRGEGRD